MCVCAVSQSRVSRSVRCGPCGFDVGLLCVPDIGYACENPPHPWCTSSGPGKVKCRRGVGQRRRRGAPYGTRQALVHVKPYRRYRASDVGVPRDVALAGCRRRIRVVWLVTYFQFSSLRFTRRYRTPRPHRALFSRSPTFNSRTDLLEIVAVHSRDALYFRCTRPSISPRAALKGE